MMDCFSVFGKNTRNELNEAINVFVLRIYLNNLFDVYSIRGCFIKYKFRLFIKGVFYLIYDNNVLKVFFYKNLLLINFCSVCAELQCNCAIFYKV